MDPQIRLLGILHIIYGLLMVVPSLIIIITLSGIGIFSGNTEAMTTLSVIASIAAAVLIILAAPSLLAGISLLANWSWGLILALIVGVVNILNFPLGSALGIYSIYVYNKVHTAKN